MEGDNVMQKRKIVTRRGFIKGSFYVAAFTIVPRHVLGGADNTPPSEKFGGALIGCGGRETVLSRGWGRMSKNGLSVMSGF